MTRKAVSFRYFRSPHKFSTYTDKPQLCSVCGRERPGYEGPFIAEGEVEFICEECLAAGKLAGLDATANQGDFDALTRQIQAAHPEFDEAQVQSAAEPLRAELEQRTPSPTTWQDFLWPAHCGDFCCYIKEAGQPDLRRIAREGDTAELFPDEEPDDFEEWLDGIRPDSPRDNSTPYSTSVYLFQCLHCSQYVVLWDSD
jgi:uncharacterized protein CbrC (UPF0167 family)